MRYALLVYSNEEKASQRSELERQAGMAAYRAFGEEHKKPVLDGAALLPTSSLETTVRVREGKALTTDGPFAETKEQLGGFYLVDVETLDEAIQIATQIPDAANGSVVIRSVLRQWRD